MKTQKYLLIGTLILMLFLLLTSCFEYHEDYGPIQELEKEYAVLDFDRLDMGEAFVIDVRKDEFYSVRVKGDRRNIDDLRVVKTGSTLQIYYSDCEERQYTTYITITMPRLESVHFSGASVSTVDGFSETSEFDCILSGASISQLSIEAQQVKLNVSGASKLTLTGSAQELKATVSGASFYSGFNFPVLDAVVDASGASKINVAASQTLEASASGASVVLYRGNPSVTSNTSGASSVMQD